MTCQKVDMLWTSEELDWLESPALPETTPFTLQIGTLRRLVAMARKSIEPMTCARCGHTRGSHNDNGCCWDDPCPYSCRQFATLLPPEEVRPNFEYLRHVVNGGDSPNPKPVEHPDDSLNFDDDTLMQIIAERFEKSDTTEISVRDGRWVVLKYYELKARLADKGGVSSCDNRR